VPVNQRCSGELAKLIPKPLKALTLQYNQTVYLYTFLFSEFCSLANFFFSVAWASKSRRPSKVDFTKYCKPIIMFTISAIWSKGTHESITFWRRPIYIAIAYRRPLPIAGPVRNHMNMCLTISDGTSHGFGELSPLNGSLSPPPVKYTGQKSEGKLCEIFKFWWFLQSTFANDVCKLLQLQLVREFAPGPHWGDFRPPDPLDCTPKWKFLASSLPIIGGGFT